jgi:hypothetical protein
MQKNASWRQSENYHLLRYAHPESLRRTTTYASFLGISQALHLAAFKQPLKKLVARHKSWREDKEAGRKMVGDGLWTAEAE